MSTAGWKLATTTQKRPQNEPHLACTLILDFPAYKSVRENFLLFKHSIYSIFIALWLIYNIVLVLGVWQTVCSIHIYGIYTFFIRFFSITGYYKILSIVPCAPVAQVD